MKTTKINTTREATLRINEIETRLDAIRFTKDFMSAIKSESISKNWIDILIQDFANHCEFNGIEN